ncbi:MAG: hypothetical protein Q9191_002230 [Dirinaria sp. TL-2023a]
MFQRLSRLTAAFIILNLVVTSNAAIAMLPAKPIPVAFSRENLSTIFVETATRRLQNITSDKDQNFRDVKCYDIPDATVNLHSCQPLFAKLFEGGHAYDPNEMSNGGRYRLDSEPCVITISSPNRADRRIRISMAALVWYASEVLRTCQELSNGGAYTFQGTWQVIVTRDPYIGSLGDGRLAED